MLFVNVIKKRYEDPEGLEIDSSVKLRSVRSFNGISIRSDYSLDLAEEDILGRDPYQQNRTVAWADECEPDCKNFPRAEYHYEDSVSKQLLVLSCAFLSIQSCPPAASS